MSNRKQLASLRLTRTVGASTLTSSIDPCSFMYPHYGLQITVKLDQQKGTLHKRQSMDTVTEADVQQLLDQVKVHGCEQCGKPALDVTTIQTNKLGLCGVCIDEHCQREFERDMAEDAQELERELAAAKADGKAKGFTHFVTAVIHPEQGDDHYHFMLTKTEDPATIEAMIARQGSQITTDYRIEAL
ncbi:hypothetical protein NPS53_09315 [Pseudomonas putida]|uniref:hypothetical protein n=1 Tax=Pseudomonas putida TaxID=303 RepID=UPI0023646046|nr:hypothetical protein [Pseudomonas putida]MDD2139775.1 hypothetical protein [Pseudomonas putida]HDS1721699.1 hypothetical protein [Pseudomonas putida]